MSSAFLPCIAAHVDFATTPPAVYTRCPRAGISNSCTTPGGYMESLHRPAVFRQRAKFCSEPPRWGCGARSLARKVRRVSDGSRANHHRTRPNQEHSHYRHIWLEDNLCGQLDAPVSRAGSKGAACNRAFAATAGIVVAEEAGLNSIQRRIQRILNVRIRSAVIAAVESIEGADL